MSKNRQEAWRKAGRCLGRACRAMKSVAQDEAGVTAIEYALLASLIALVAVTSIKALGVALSAIWAGIASAVAGAL